MVIPMGTPHEEISILFTTQLRNAIFHRTRNYFTYCYSNSWSDSVYLMECTIYYLEINTYSLTAFMINAGLITGLVVVVQNL